MLNDREIRHSAILFQAGCALFDGRISKWRTPDGIAKSSGLTIEQVIQYLDTAEAIIRARSPNAKGEPLFTTTEKYLKNTGLALRVLSAITNKVAE